MTKCSTQGWVQPRGWNFNPASASRLDISTPELNSVLGWKCFHLIVSTHGWNYRELFEHTCRLVGYHISCLLIGYATSRLLPIENSKWRKIRVLHFCRSVWWFFGRLVEQFCNKKTPKKATKILNF
jgi:hypothetical protein